MSLPVSSSSSLTEVIERIPSTFLSAADIVAYYEQGYVIVKGAYSAREVREMSDTVNVMMARIFCQLSTATSMEKKQAAYIEGSQVVFTKTEGKPASISRIVGCGSMDPSLLELLRSDKMVYTFLDLLNCEEMEHLICQFHPKLPGDNTSFPKHRDSDIRRKFDPEWKDVKGNGSYAIAIIAVDPMTPENGGLIIDKKSFPNQGTESEEVAVKLAPGDMIFMHPDIVHWSGPNISAISRRTLLTGFCVAGANHKNYPGNCTNDLISVEAGRVRAQAAPWKKMDDQSFTV